MQGISQHVLLTIVLFVRTALSFKCVLVVSDVLYRLQRLQLLFQLLLSDHQLGVFDVLLLRKSQSRVKKVDHVLHIVQTQGVLVRRT